jgi:hypothetical protein
MSTSDARAFDHVVIIMFENEYRSYVHKNPYMRRLAAQGIDMATYFGVMHPSNTNYTASVAGTICNITSDPHYNTLMPGSPPVMPPDMLERPTVVDRIRDKKLDWKGYMETYQPIAYPAGVDMIMAENDSASITMTIAAAAGTETVKSPPPDPSQAPPDVLISLSAPATIVAGETVSVQIAVYNGASFAFNLVVDVPATAPLTFVSATANGKAATFPYQNSMLYPTQPVMITAVYSAPAGSTGNVTLTATVSSVNQIKTVQHTILDYPPYLNIHNPFVQFRSIRENPEQWMRIGTAYDFLRDALNGTLPEYSWFTPDIWGDGHWIWGTYDEAAERGTCLVNQLAKWLETFFAILNFPGPNSRLPPRTLVVVTFDEADYDVSWDALEEYDGTYDGPNQVYTVLLGDVVKPGVIDGEGYNHYSLLKTIEKNFDLDTLGTNDTSANWFQFLWNRTFQWNAAADTPITADFAAAAEFANALYVVYGTAAGAACRTFANGSWSNESSVAAPDGTTAVALAACGDQLVLVCNSGGTLSALTYSAGGSMWTTPQPIVTGASAFALTGFLDYADQTQKLMLAWSTAANAIQSQVFAGGAWGSPVTVGQETDGQLTLAVLGASLFLIHKAVGSDSMNVVSYNTAPFNVVTTTNHENEATQGLWSPSEFPVAHYGFAPSRSTPDNPEPLLHPFQGVAPFAAAELDGVVHLAHPAVNGPQVLAERFSLSGILTPACPVNYESDAAGTSNGYGTLAQAGWSRQLPIPGVESAGAMTMSRAGDQLALLFQPAAGGPLRMTLGGYS